MSDDWYREQTRQAQIRDTRQFEEQLFRNQVDNDLRISTQRIQQGNVDRHVERQRGFEDESRDSRQRGLNQIIDGIHLVDQDTATARSRPNGGGAGRTEQFSWGKLLATGIVLGAVYLANHYEQKATRHQDSPLQAARVG